MTEKRLLPNETLENALGVYKTTVEVCKDVEEEDYNPALDKVTILFLEELKAYREIGTLDECRIAVERKRFRP